MHPHHRTHTGVDAIGKAHGAKVALYAVTQEKAGSSPHPEPSAVFGEKAADAIITWTHVLRREPMRREAVAIETAQPLFRAYPDKAVGVLNQSNNQ
jgi:hypothetical protein